MKENNKATGGKGGHGVLKEPERRKRNNKIKEKKGTAIVEFKGE